MIEPFKSLVEFESAVEIVPPQAADELRRHFIAQLIDSKHAGASEALSLRQYPDGLAYSGYLWDYLSDKRVVSEDELWGRLAQKSCVYAMWDLHSAERVEISDYFKFPRGTVLRSDPETLRRGLEFLPEDLYVFDESCRWTAVLTHEEEDQQHFCLWSEASNLHFQ